MPAPQKENQLELHNLLENVKDEATFLVFAKALYEDKEDETIKNRVNALPQLFEGSNSWQNTSIEGFLESAIAFTEDSPQWQGEKNLWRKFALFLYGGKIYE